MRIWTIASYAIITDQHEPGPIRSTDIENLVYINVPLDRKLAALGGLKLLAQISIGGG